jgi:hypothetical protein
LVLPRWETNAPSLQFSGRASVSAPLRGLAARRVELDDLSRHGYDGVLSGAFVIGRMPAEELMKAVACVAVITTIAMLGGATAQTKAHTKTRSFTVKQGATVPIGKYYQINTRNCQSGPIPKIVQTSTPTIGKLIIEETKVEPDQKQCKGFLIPGYVVRFQAGEKGGQEKVTYNVIYQSKSLGTWNVENNITVQ